MSLLIPALLLALAAPLVIALMRASELFVLRARKGRIALVRGRIPPRLLDDLREVIARAGIEAVELRAVVEDGRPKLYPRGEIARPVRQQLRNVIGQWQVSDLRKAPRARASRLS